MLGILACAPAQAQEPGAAAPADTAFRPTPEAGPLRVGAIRVVGNAGVDSARILRTFEVAPGARFSADAIQRGIRKLFALGLFRDAWVERLERGDEVDLVVHVVERPRIASIRFSGNQRRESSDLERKLFLKTDQPYSPAVVQTQVDSLLLYYREEGFPRAAVTARTDTTGAGGHVAVVFEVQEGERVRITAIEFRGASAFPAKKLRKAIATRTKGLFGGGDIKDESFAEDREKLTAWYQNRGYRDARVTGHELAAGRRPRDLTLVLTVEEGPAYAFGTVGWTGNVVLGETELRKLWKGDPGSTYDQSAIQRTQGLIYAEYAEQGYLYLGVEPRENVQDQRVDVVFAISEGAPSRVRQVNITGNRGTREKVIRRELDIREGDRFKRSALVRSQGDIMRLGFFEDAQPDFVAAESTDVDLVFRVKEKQVGTASAGAGYTAESGLTGFLELGHNNVLGNGQTVSLHLERGARRSDYYVSFTEPWFRDTPTLLGFSLFNTDRERDLFAEKRRGGSGRIGRPLPWPDYSRGSVSYSLEDVTIRIDKPESLFTTQDSIVLRGLRNGDPVRTSSVNLFFLRNSANNPFYPTAGSRVSVETEIAGGPWGGSVNFHKHRIEAKAYFPSLVRGVTTMLRARVGLLGEYLDQNRAAPQYERFRLGGGTTPDPLRGYDDYMLVPEKFIRQVPVAFRPDTTIAGTDTTITQIGTRFGTIRYPGGRFMTLLSLEQQFPIAHPLHGVLFFDAGNTWDLFSEARPLDLKMGAGIGIRLEIPLLGNIGFDYGYGFNRRDLGDSPKFVGHFLIGQQSF